MASITPTQGSGYQQSLMTDQRQADKTADKDTARASAAEQQLLARKQHNLAILEANQSQSAGLTVANQPLSLVYQAAIDAINKELQPLLGDNALQRGQQQELDVSPEATADRIVSLTTGLFSRYQEQRPELADVQQVEQFTEIIRSGIEQGFAEAKDILAGLKVLEGDIAANIDKTFELVQSGLDQWRDQQLTALRNADQGGEA